MLKALFYIFLFLTVGELLQTVFDLPVSGSILGMILIFIALKLKLLKIETVKPASDKLVKYMVLFFVPYGVGLMVYIDIIKAHWIVISVAAGLSTLITLYVTAIIQQKLEKHD
jgi:holin-like protein